MTSFHAALGAWFVAWVLDIYALGEDHESWRWSIVLFLLGWLLLLKGVFDGRF